jgi:hypothetical protein
MIARRPSLLETGEGSTAHRRLADAVGRSGGVRCGGTMARTRDATGETLLAPSRNRRSKVGRITSERWEVGRRREGVGRARSSEEAG